MKLRIEQVGRLYRIALSSPETRNVVDTPRELLREIREAEAAPGVGAILLEADGHIFCAGCEPDEELLSIGRKLS
jgi:enoyl-CoA hydratase/carnithine racemase